MTAQPETPSRPKPWRRAALAAVLLAGTTLGGFAISQADAADQNNPNPATDNTGTPVNPPGTHATPQPLPDFSALVTQVKPAVVSITTRLQQNAAMDEDNDNGDNGRCRNCRSRSIR
jgi:S1-C subfamily serine protease